MTTNQVDIVDLCSPEKKRPAAELLAHAFTHKNKNDGGGGVIDLLSDSDDEDDKKKASATLNANARQRKHARTTAPPLPPPSSTKAAPAASRLPLGPDFNWQLFGLRNDNVTSAPRQSVALRKREHTPSVQGQPSNTGRSAIDRGDGAALDVASASRPRGFRAATATANNDDDDEIAIVGSIGTNVLADFPILVKVAF